VSQWVRIRRTGIDSVSATLHYTMTDTTDATFETDVVERSKTVPVVVDLWAEWCGPCKQLGPILEKVIAATGGQVELVKVDVDANPSVSQAFKVQSIPAVYAMKDGQVVDGFTGAQGEAQVQEFVDRLLPTSEQSELEQLIEAGDEASLVKALEIEADNPAAVTALAALLVDQGEVEAGLALLERIPESAETRRIVATARTGGVGDDVEATLAELLTSVKFDDDARQKFVDLLEVLGPDDPRATEWRRKLSTALF
jgi:putative thioredoxin